MAGNSIGSIKTAAKRIGVPAEQYLQLRSAGLKWCFACCKWKALALFGADATRSDGFKAKCRDCVYTRRIDHPSKEEFRRMKTQGMAWCRICQGWHPLAEMSNSMCKEHSRAAQRERYKSDENYRHRTKQFIRARKRKILRMSAEAAESRMALFRGCCAYCGSKATTWDHVLPVVLGGDTTPDNIVPACSSCNSSKNASEVFEWLDKKNMMPTPEFLEFCGHAGIFPSD